MVDKQQSAEVQLLELDVSHAVQYLGQEAALVGTGVGVKPINLDTVNILDTEHSGMVTVAKVTGHHFEGTAGSGSK